MAETIDPARPVSVSDLRKKFEGKGKAQSPAEFHSVNRASAARHNLTVRMQQVADRKKQQRPNDPKDDPRALGSFDEESRALQSVLDSDVLVGDDEIDQFNVKELKTFITSKGGVVPTRCNIADLRVAGLKVKKQQASDDLEQAEIELFAPQLTNALSKGSENDVNRAILTMFFEEYDASRLADIDSLLEQHKGEEDELFAELAWKYPEHANRIVAFSINASYGDPPSHPVVNPARRRVSYLVAGVKS